MKKILVWQFSILLAGTLFAWSSFGYELYNWICAGKLVGCAINVSNPFYSSCFYGAIGFTVAFILSIISLKKFGKQ